MKTKFNQKWIAAALFLMAIMWFSISREGAEGQQASIDVYKLTDEEKSMAMGNTPSTI